MNLPFSQRHHNACASVPLASAASQFHIYSNISEKSLTSGSVDRVFFPLGPALAPFILSGFDNKSLQAHDDTFLALHATTRRGCKQRLTIQMMGYIIALALALCSR
jgi:hypothetical protein